MREVLVSTKYQVVIPKEVREALAVRPGDKFWIEAREGRIELTPVHGSSRAARGFLRGIDTSVPREQDRV